MHIQEATYLADVVERRKMLVASSLDRPANLLQGGQRLVEPVAPARAAVMICNDA